MGSFADDVANKLALSLKTLQEDEQSKAQAQVLRYKTVLSQTEELLNLLQSRVEAEEQSWKEKMAQLEKELASTKQEGQFWMEQCRKQTTEHTSEQVIEQTTEQSVQQSTEMISLQTQFNALEKEKEAIAQELEKLRLEKISELENSQRQLAAAEEMAAREKEAAQSLREQLDAAKAAVPTKVADTNGNGTTTEEWSVTSTQPISISSGNHKNKNRKKKAASRYGV